MVVISHNRRHPCARELDGALEQCRAYAAVLHERVERDELALPVSQPVGGYADGLGPCHAHQRWELAQLESPPAADHHPGGAPALSQPPEERFALAGAGCAHGQSAPVHHLAR